jgi:hypothetical protein
MQIAQHPTLLSPPFPNQMTKHPNPNPRKKPTQANKMETKPNKQYVSYSFKHFDFLQAQCLHPFPSAASSTFCLLKHETPQIRRPKILRRKPNQQTKTPQVEEPNPHLLTF